MKHLLLLAVFAILASPLTSKAEDQADRGSQIYMQSRCFACHGQLGTGGFGPTLAGDRILAIQKFVIAQILIGRGKMPAFGDRLSDDAIAAVAQYIRNNWGNHYGPVTPRRRVIRPRAHEESIRWVRKGGNSRKALKEVTMGGTRRLIGCWKLASSILIAAPLVLSNPAWSQEQPPNRAPEANAPPTPQNAAEKHNTDISALIKDDDQWPMAAKDYANTRFSHLDQINKNNVGQLQMAWSFSLGVPRGQEAAPLAVNGVVYVVGPYAGVHPNQVFALDVSNGDLKWSYAPKPDPAAQGVACCDVVTRGLAYDNGKIFLNTLDGFSVAIDANTGKELWHTKLADINKGETITMAPVVVKGKVLIGNSGGEMGVRGWLAAVDEETGKIAWRAYSTGPDAEVLIGDDYRGPYDWLNGKDLGVKTWPPDKWKIGGGTVWGWISYDPDLNLIYYGTSNPGAWNHEQRPGDNLFGSTIFARNPDTGMAKWAYQPDPHDLWDYDEINEVVVADLTIDNQVRKVLIHPGRNGFMYVIDRARGKVISADTYDYVNSIKSIDLNTGRPVLNDALTPSLGKTVRNVCPAAPGAKDWQPSAWSPKTKLLYVPHQHLCMDFKTSNVGYIEGTPYVGADVDMYAGPGGYRGEFMAWDPVQRKKVWSIKEKFPVWSGALVTAGDVAFYGTMDRWFKAVDANSGEELWKFRAGSGFIGQPVAFSGSDGTQYIAIISGVGGWSGAVAVAELDPRVRNGALGFTGAMQDLPASTVGGATLAVFSLPKNQKKAASAQ